MDKDGKLNITWIPAKRYTHWQLNPKLIMLHAGGTTGKGIVNTFTNPSAKGSAHYVVHEDGAITQMVSEDFIAWHAGRSKYKDYPTKDLSSLEWNSLNVCAIGIEFAGPPSCIHRQQWPEEELTSGIRLVREIAQRYPGIKLIDHWICTEHGKPESRSDVRDYKGIDLFPWERFINETSIEEA